MIILLPFKLLKVRDEFKKAYESNDAGDLKKVISELREVYENDILKTIDDGFKNGILSRNDRFVLISMTKRLFDHLYSKYSSVEGVDTMLHDESLDLEIDRLIDRNEELTSRLEEKDRIIAEKEAEYAEKDAEYAEKEAEYAEMKAENAEMKAMIKQLTEQLEKQKL